MKVYVATAAIITDEEESPDETSVWTVEEDAYKFVCGRMIKSLHDVAALIQKQNEDPYQALELVEDLNGYINRFEYAEAIEAYYNTVPEEAASAFSVVGCEVKSNIKN